MKKLIAIIVYVLPLVAFCQNNAVKDTIYLRGGKVVVCEIIDMDQEKIFVNETQAGISTIYSIERIDIKKVGKTTNLNKIRETEVVTNSNSQPISNGTKPIKTNPVTENSLMYNVGSELRTYSSRWYTGIALEVTGTIATTFGIAMNANSKADANGKKDNSGNTVAFVGAGLSIVGLIFIIESVSHIGKAGKLLQGNSSKISITPAHNMPGMGIAMKIK